MSDMIGRPEDEAALPVNVVRALDEDAPVTAAADIGPMYRVDPRTKVPVSKKYGPLWKSRIDAANSSRKVHVDAWDECIRYYNNDQLPHRQAVDGKSGNRYFSARRNQQWSETENVVYANTRAIVPALYMKNPQVKFTCTDAAKEDYFERLEQLVNTLANKQHSPGLNLKVHARNGVQTAELCNLAWMEIGFVERAQSSEQARTLLNELAGKLAEAKDAKEIREIEGQLMALEEEVDILNPPGPFARYRPPHDVLIDPDSCVSDFSDAKWCADKLFFPTDYLNAKYGEKDSSGQYKAIYEPTHVLTATSNTVQDEVNNFKLFDTNAEAKTYGYDTNEQLRKAYRTCCWRIWDRVTRRVFLYADNKWDWPVWVENDPYGLPNFWPFRPLYFNTSPIGAYAHSNTTYYLDQQDAINEIHDEFRRGRQNLKENILFDRRMTRETVENWLRGSGPNAYGVDVPEGMSLKDAILEKPSLIVKAAQLFDITRPMQSIDRISGVSDVLRNVQFKTNTTNKAIENYNSSTAMRLDEKIDAIEDWMGLIMYDVAFMCAQFMDSKQVEDIIGAERAEGWINYSADELRKMYTCQAVGGSTQKPSSQARKAQAIEMVQMLSRMAQFAPRTVLQQTMTLLDGAFEEVTLPDDIFEKIEEEAMLSMQRGNSVQGGSGASETEAATASGQDVEDGTAPQLTQLAQAIDALPPQAKVALGQILARGVPVAQALPEVLRTVQAQPAQQGPQT